MHRSPTVALGLAMLGIVSACAVPDTLPRNRTLDLDLPGRDEDIGRFPSELDPPVTATASFKTKIVLKEALDAAKKSYLRYSPIIEFAVQDTRYSPRWPGATLSYHPGPSPLPPVQVELFKRAVDRLNAAVGFKVFTMLPDNASADIPVSDSSEFPSSAVLGETTARVVSRISETAISIDFTEEMRLRPGLPNGLFFKVALHELGHAAGLEHNPDANALMNRGTGFRTPDDFAQSEKESLRLLYNLADSPLKPPRKTQSVLPEPLAGWTLY